MVVATPSALLVLKKLELTLDINQALQEELSSLDLHLRLIRLRAIHHQAMPLKRLNLLQLRPPHTNTEGNLVQINHLLLLLHLTHRRPLLSNAVAVPSTLAPD